MSEKPKFDETPPDMEMHALYALVSSHPGAEREILSAYNGGDAVEKEKLFRKIIGKIYYEGYVAGVTGKIPENSFEWDTTVIDNEGEQDD